MEKRENKIINAIRRCFRDYVERGLFNSNFIGDKLEYYSGGRCHSRVLGMLVQSFHEMDYITDIERKVKFEKPYKPPQKRQNQNAFTPDITVVNNQDEIVGIIEYETIDASRDHLYQKIEYFKHVIPVHKSLQFIIFFPTLTTLGKSPNSWIEKNRQKYVIPITDELKKLSDANPKIDIYFFILDENGLFSKWIKGGEINEDTTEIW